jgi:hypothetical protein
VSLDRRPEAPEREEELVVDRADRLQNGVEQRGGVALREHEPVVPGAAGIGQVGPQVIGEQDGGQVRGGQ